MGAYGFLFSQLVRRELRQKYQGSTLGVLWYIVNPLVLMGAYTLMFGYVFKVQSKPDYPVFVMVGIAVWTFFQQSVLAAAESLINQGALVRKAAFPRETIPAASVAVQLVTLVVIVVALTIVAIVVKTGIHLALVMLPVLIVLLACFVLGFTLVIAPLHAYFRDTAPVLTALLLPWFFLTPTFFEPDSIHYVQQHPVLRTLLDWVNPVAPFIESLRSVIYGGHFPSAGRLIYAVVVGLGTLAVGVLAFRGMSGELAVVV
jgi:ABC-type polysaccharide/polyol phosphate export permease